MGGIYFSVKRKDMLIDIAYKLQHKVDTLERKLIDMEEREEQHKAELTAMRDCNKNLLAENARISSKLADERSKRV